MGMSLIRLVLCSLGIALLAACATPAGNGNDVNISQTSRGVEIRSSDSILFEPGKFEIKPGGAVFLDKVANLLNTRTRNNVIIEGHTDNTGSRQLNQDLSDVRALSVMKGLVDRGVAKNRIKAVGYGMSRPIADNGSAEGRRLNRRTDIIIVGEKQENMGKDPLGDLVKSVVDFSKRIFN